MQSGPEQLVQLHIERVAHGSMRKLRCARREVGWVVIHVGYDGGHFEATVTWASEKTVQPVPSRGREFLRLKDE